MKNLIELELVSILSIKRALLIISVFFFVCTGSVAQSVPDVFTSEVWNVTSSSAQSGGVVIDDGGAGVIAQGIVWDTNSNPTIALATKTSESLSSNVFYSTVTGLFEGSTYYVRAYATNSAGTGYGEEYSFQAVIPEFTAMNDALLAKMSQYNLPSLTVAITVQERLVYRKSFGYSDNELQTPAADSDLYRIASVSKPLTAIAILKLVQDDLLSLDANVFGSGGILENDFGVPPPGSNKDQITVRQLLDHESGWTNTPNDPMFTNIALTQSDLITDLLANRPLTNLPGTTYYYLNFGFCVLGRVIEKVTNMTYEAYVKENILTPVGINEMKIAGNTLQDRFNNEVKYYQSEFSPYSMNVTRMDAHGGWIASSTDLARLMVAIDRGSIVSDLINESLLNEMYFGFNSWFHTGSLPGTSSIVNHLNNSLNFIILTNTRDENSPGTIIDDLKNTVQTQINNRFDPWPDIDLFEEVSQNTGLSISTFSPVSGPVGTEVTIDGAGFDATAGNNTVYFGAVKAVVTSASSNQLTVIVPEGTTYQPISVLVNGSITQSKLSFLSTFAGVQLNGNSFAAKEDLSTGQKPNTVVMVDLDGDTKPDLVTNNSFVSSFSVFKNTSISADAISFAARQDISTIQYPSAITTEDLDGDGRKDVVLVSGNQKMISIFMNTSSVGNISFAEKIDYATTNALSAIQIGDIDLDGKLDLVGIDFQNILVFLNTSTGPGSISFGSVQNTVTGFVPSKLALGDLDNDGKIDVGTLDFSSDLISIYRNTSSGVGNVNFAAKEDISAANPLSLSMLDFDEDGKLDLIVGDQFFQNSSTNTGNISFAAYTNIGSNIGKAFSIADLVGNGKNDMVSVLEQTDKVIIHSHIDNSTSLAYDISLDLDTGDKPVFAKAGDLNADGRPDFVVANNSSNTLSIFRNTTSIVNSPPVINDQIFTIDENAANASSVGTVVATDSDNDDLTFAITAGNELGGFSINEITGELLVADQSVLDFETNPTFTLTVEVDDGNGGSDNAIITIDLVDVNESSNNSPTIEDQGFAIDEYSVFGSPVASIIASDPDGDNLTFSIISGNTSNAFEINVGTGELTVNNAAALDFEIIPLFVLNVEVNDGNGGMANANITININDIDETGNTAPTISDQIFALDENSENGTVVGTVVANDTDGDLLYYSIISGNEFGGFSLGDYSGLLEVNDGSILDFETTPSINLTVQINDGNGGIVDASITINLNDVDENSNQAPIIENQSFDYGENATQGELVGDVQASDPDFDPLTFTILSGNVDNAFTLNSGTGSLTVNNVDAFDFETRPSFDLTVQVYDGSVSASADVTINIGDVDEVTISLAGNLSFGEVVVGESATLPLTITNLGIMDLTNINLSLPDGLSTDFANGFLQGGQSTIANITFTPAEGAYSGNITVTSNAEEGDNTIGFSGEGIIPAPTISVTGDLDFGSAFIGETIYKSLVFKNTGSADLDVSSFTLPEGLIAGTSSVSGVPPNGEFSVGFGFAPTEEKVYTGTVIVNSNAEGGTTEVSFQGIGLLPGPRIAISGDLDFGNVLLSTSDSRSIIVTNEGNADLTISGLVLPEGFSTSFSTATVAADAQESITVQFEPTEEKTYDGTLEIQSDAIAGTSTLSVSGNGYVVPLNVKDEGLGLKVYPMPFEDLLTIQKDEETRITTIDFFAVDGRLIMHKKVTAEQTTEVTIDLSALQPGIYLLSIKGDDSDEGMTFKVVKK